MRIVAVLLLCSIAFLSSFSGIRKPLQFTAKKTCCERISVKKVCHGKKAKYDDDCKPDCATLLTCSVCGFLAEQPLGINPGFFSIHLKPVALYKIGKLSGYHKADWKPPKVC